jgi:hypothetical protein
MKKAPGVILALFLGFSAGANICRSASLATLPWHLVFGWPWLTPLGSPCWRAFWLRSHLAALNFACAKLACAEIRIVSYAAGVRFPQSACAGRSA